MGQSSFLSPDAESRRHRREPQALACKFSYPTQRYNDNTVLGPFEPFAYRQNLTARWCFDPTKHHAQWDGIQKNLYVRPTQIAPGYTILGLMENSRQFDGAHAFSVNGFSTGGVEILGECHMQNSYTFAGPKMQEWRDLLAIDGRYDGHWLRDSNDPGCGKRMSCSPYKRVNG